MGKSKKSREGPSNLAAKLAASVFKEQASIDRLLQSFSVEHAERQAILWLQDRPKVLPFETLEPLSFQPDFVDVVDKALRPGKEDLHQEGAYYCLDPSSVFCASIMQEVRSLSEGGLQNIVDVCASPGGKSIFAYRALKPEFLLSNETIRKRVGGLRSNFERCKISNAAIVSEDPSRLAEKIPSSADLVIVDAPCSGQSLLARGIESPGCFHPATINMNANRQKRILANSSKVVAPNGFLAYMTCTYSPQENEAVLSWFLKKFPEFQSVSVNRLLEYQSHLTSSPCYRLLPWQGGAGGFCALLKRSGEGERLPLSREQLFFLWGGPG